MQIKGIDVSKWQGNIDFAKVKSDGVGFVIIRAGYGKELSQKDVCFENNYANAKAAGLPVGAYWYSYATSASEAEAEAKACLECIKDKQFEYPIFYDVEESNTLKLGKSTVSSIIKTFCSYLEKQVYFVGLYMSRSALSSYVTDEVQKAYALWVAEWGSKCNYSGCGKIGLWQSSSTGNVTGISGNVDLDTAYVDYPTTIQNGGFNGFTAAQTSGTSQSGAVTTLKTYNYADKTQLTEHFNVSEFRCKCDEEHDTILDTVLIDMLEQIYAVLNCSKIIVNSGYRCTKHDKTVGGTGTGQHTKGKAADIVCYDHIGNKISTKIVTCAAQDLGFNGIGKINDTATHVDIRIDSKWYGDETITSSKSITNDFYDYWGFTQEDVYGKSKSSAPDTSTDSDGESKEVKLTIDGKTYSGSLKEE